MGVEKITVPISIIIGLALGIPLLLILIGFILSFIKLAQITKKTGSTKYMRKMFWMIFVNLICSFLSFGACHVYDRHHLDSNEEIEHQIKIKQYKDEEIRKFQEKKKKFHQDNLQGYEFDEPEEIPEMPTNEEFIITKESIEKIQTLIGTKEEVSLQWLSTVAIIPIIKVEEIVTLHLGFFIEDGKIVNKKS